MESLVSFVITLESMQIKKGIDMKRYVRARNCLETTSKAFDIMANKNVDVYLFKVCLVSYSTIVKQLSNYNTEIKELDRKLGLDEFKILKEALIEK